MNDTKKHREELPHDPDPRRRPTDSEVEIFMHKYMLTCAREEGYAIGFAIGLRESLTCRLSEQFGPVPAWAAERIEQAPTEQLRAYLRALATECTIESVLNAKP